MTGSQYDVGVGEAVRIGIALQCPRCRSGMRGLECLRCRFQMQVREEIYCMRFCRSERRIMRRFIDDYECIRSKEGRGSQNGEFYLGLPYKDASGRNAMQWKIRLYAFSNVLIEERSEAAPLTRWAHPGSWRRQWLDESFAWHSLDSILSRWTCSQMSRMVSLAQLPHYHRYLPKSFPRFQAEMLLLPFEDGQFDAIVFNASFHYSEDYEASLREALRCLRIGGTVIISDTPWYSREESGRQMIAERHAAFLQRYGTASDSINAKPPNFLRINACDCWKSNCRSGGPSIDRSMAQSGLCDP